MGERKVCERGHPGSAIVLYQGERCPLCAREQHVRVLFDVLVSAGVLPGLPDDEHRWILLDGAIHLLGPYFGHCDRELGCDHEEIAPIPVSELVRAPSK